MNTVYFKATDCINSNTIKWKQDIKKDDDMFREGYLYLRDRFGGFHNYVIMKAGYETSIPRKKAKLLKCYGCLEEQLNQMAHMDCPDGCLHDKVACDLCSSS